MFTEQAGDDWRFDQHRGRGRMNGRHGDEKRLGTAGATQPTVHERLRKSLTTLCGLLEEFAMITDFSKMHNAR